LTKIDPYNAVIPSISRKAWITVIRSYSLESDDHFSEGFTRGVSGNEYASEIVGYQNADQIYEMDVEKSQLRKMRKYLIVSIK
jgi:hypothetical protein